MSLSNLIGFQGYDVSYVHFMLFSFNEFGIFSIENEIRHLTYMSSIYRVIIS